MSTATSPECSNCGLKRRWILHHVRVRGIHRRVCTTCVLRLHPSSFCPACFHVYDQTSLPPHSKRLTCSKCSSITHSHCLPPASASSSSAAPYVCSPCAASPASFSFFDLDSSPSSLRRPLDDRLALVLLCAAKISAASMSKAVLLARAEAERRVREAATARKRARDAIDNLALVLAARTPPHTNGNRPAPAAAAAAAAAPPPPLPPPTPTPTPSRAMVFEVKKESNGD